MKMKDYKLKDGKSFRIPAVFLNPQTELDARVLRETNDRFPETPIRQIQVKEGFDGRLESFDEICESPRQRADLAKRGEYDP